MSLKDYAERFSLELVVLGIALIAIITNISIKNHTDGQIATQDSVIFSFLRSHPSLNENLIAAVDTTTIQARTDLQIGNVASSGFGVTLASAHTNTGSDLTTIQSGVAIKTNPADTQGINRTGVTKYNVQSGDTIIGVAASFGVSPETIMMENKLNPGSVIKPGQELTILPTTGISYTIKDGDTLESLTKKYEISEIDFLDYNNLETFEDLALGSSVVIPLRSVSLPAVAKPASSIVTNNSGRVALTEQAAPANLAAAAGSFIWPTAARNITQGFSSRHTALDISNSKRVDIYASAAGFVEISGYQSNGYGNTIVINHGNGFKTRYAHASKLYVKAGDHVEQGQVIAEQGNTGRVRGATGIHLHFEILKNGGKVNPLGYVRP